jgi:hypothetical protein
MIQGTRITTLCIAFFFSLSLAASAGKVAELTKFNNGERADAEQVNANFTAVKVAVDDNDKKINDLSQPRSASVTYSAVGFVPENHKVGFVKSKNDGSLSLSEGGDGERFFHCLTLRSGVTITRIRAHVNAVTVGLYKQGNDEPLATSDDTEDINLTIEPFPASYFVAVILSNPEQIFYSVAIDYTYTEP